MADIDVQDLQYQCCFCGERIAKPAAGGDSLDPCAIVVIARWERPETEQGVQQFFCHVGCFDQHAKHGMLEREVLSSANRAAT